MIQLIKIFHFEMAHAIHGYPGVCKNIHGHSYELHVAVSTADDSLDYIPDPGFIIDFKEIKMLVNTFVIERLDHKVVLSHRFLLENPSFFSPQNLFTWQVEPTAENILLYIVKELSARLPKAVSLSHLKLFETKDSYAEWTNSSVFKRRSQYS